MLLCEQSKVAFNLVRHGTQLGEHDCETLFRNGSKWGANPVHLVEEHLNEFIRQRSRVTVSSEDIFEV